MTISAAQADAFYEEVLRFGEVWALRDGDGDPAPFNEDGRRSMPFWSLASRAQLIEATVASYKEFVVTPIPLAEWRSRWLPGLARDGLLIGLNWSGVRASGYDVEPSDAFASLTAREQLTDR